MRIVAWLLGLLMAVAVVFFGAQIIASETGEVVVLHTADEQGGEASTRLWVVDDEGHQWLRAGGDSGWFARLTRQPRVALDRAGVRRTYDARPEPDRAARINELMAQKYGWRDTVVALLAGSRDGAVAIRLVPAEDASAR